MMQFLRKSMQPRDREDGFTLVELMVVMVLTLLFSGLVLNFFFDLWGSTATLENDSETFVSREDAGDALRNDFNAASGLIIQTDIPDANVSNTDPANPSSGYWEPLHAVPGTTAMPSTGTTPILYYTAPSIDSNKNFIMNGSQAYQDNFVLYLDASTHSLMLRSLANPSATGDTNKTSCPLSKATSTCPADKTISSNISSVSENYYSRSDNVINYESSTDPLTGLYTGPDFPLVEVLQLTLSEHHASTLHGATDTNNQTVVRVAFRNK